MDVPDLSNSSPRGSDHREAPISPSPEPQTPPRREAEVLPIPQKTSPTTEDLRRRWWALSHGGDHTAEALPAFSEFVSLHQTPPIGRGEDELEALQAFSEFVSLHQTPPIGRGEDELEAQPAAGAEPGHEEEEEEEEEKEEKEEEEKKDSAPAFQQATCAQPLSAPESPRAPTKILPDEPKLAAQAAGREGRLHSFNKPSPSSATAAASPPSESRSSADKAPAQITTTAPPSSSVPSPLPTKEPKFRTSVTWISPTKLRVPRPSSLSNPASSMKPRTSESNGHGSSNLASTTKPRSSESSGSGPSNPAAQLRTSQFGRSSNPSSTTKLRTPELRESSNPSSGTRCRVPELPLNRIQSQKPEDESAGKPLPHSAGRVLQAVQEEPWPPSTIQSPSLSSSASSTASPSRRGGRLRTRPRPASWDPLNPAPPQQGRGSNSLAGRFERRTLLASAAMRGAGALLGGIASVGLVVELAWQLGPHPASLPAFS